MRAIVILPGVLLLAACGGGLAPAPVAAVSQPETRMPHHAQQHDRDRADGAAGVIGADAEMLLRTFGAPRLDIRDGDARKLQWSGTMCVLDAYLYPGPGGARPSATFIDTRRGDGRDIDHAACIAALRKN